MKDLEYRIGGLLVSKPLLRFTGTDPYESAHKFIVESKGNIASIFIAHAVSHYSVFLQFKYRNIPIEETCIVGGGSVYSANDTLVLDDYSADYGSIPGYAAARFAFLVLGRFRESGIYQARFRVNPDDDKLNDFWKC
ncbi:MAG: hypothetical protein ABII01_02275 [Candidatus Woesearchaeota archaeon]